MLLAISSTLPMISVYFIKENINVLSYLPFSINIDINISFAIYTILPIFIAKLIILAPRKFLSKDSIVNDKIIDVEYANNSFLPSYLGYFFVALSIPRGKALFCIIYMIVVVFVYLSQSSYFNPLFMFFGYKFYNIKKANGIKIFIITKRKIKNTDNLKFENLLRINDFSFIEIGEKK